jgi:hypothetical protein
MWHTVKVVWHDVLPKVLVTRHVPWPLTNAGHQPDALKMHSHNCVVKSVSSFRLNWKTTSRDLDENAHSFNSRQRERFKRFLSHPNPYPRKRACNLFWFWYKFRVATRIGRLVENVNVRTQGLEEGSWVSQTQWVAATLLVWGPANPLFFMPWIAWSLFCLNRCNRLSPLSHYRVVKGPGFGWTYPIWNYDLLRGWTNWFVSRGWCMFHWVQI